MKQLLIIISLFFFAGSFTFAQSDVWSDASASVLKKGRLEWSLLGKKRLGIKNNMELIAQPFFFFISPHIGLKKQWNTHSDFNLASVHRIGYPSILLKIMSREGTGGILPKDSTIPQIITFKNAIIVSKNIKTHYFAAANLGVELALSLGESDFPEIDFPFIYRRTAVYHNQFVPYLGIHLGGQLISKIDFELAFTAYKMTNDIGGLIFEDKAVLFWKKSNKFGVKAGVASVFGKYAYGNDARLIPVIDVVLGFGGSQQKS